ncbi:MAG: sensor histidine kinase [Fervidobacterium sp.]
MKIALFLQLIVLIIFVFSMYLLPSNAYFLSIISTFVIVNTIGLFYVVLKIWVMNLKKAKLLIKITNTILLIIAIAGVIILFKSMFELWIASYQEVVLVTFLNSLLIISTFLLLAFGIAYLTLRKELEQKIYEYKKLEETQLLLKFEAIKSKYNPHFLFNAISVAISMLDLDCERETVKEYLMNVSDLLRKSIDAPEMWSVEEEFELVRKYLEIQEKRYNSRLKFEIELPQECSKRKIPALILQPIVENAIIHGISKLTSGGLIKVSCTPLGNFSFVLEVFDNGPGVKHFEKRTGLKIVEERIKLFSNNAFVDYIIQENEGTRVRLIFS